MRYLGIAKKEHGRVVMPDTFADVSEGQTFEAFEIAGDILLAVPPLDRTRLEQVARLAKQSIDEHRTSLEGLAR